MKTNLKYYLMVAVLMMAVSVMAQTFPVMEMQSTSRMVSSGSNLPSAANNGVSMATMPGSDMGSYSPARGPRRAWGDDEDDEERGDGNLSGGENGQGGPDQPVGAMPWMLMLLLCGGYAAAAAYRRREEIRG